MNQRSILGRENLPFNISGVFAYISLLALYVIQFTYIGIFIVTLNTKIK